MKNPSRERNHLWLKHILNEKNAFNVFLFSVIKTMKKWQNVKFWLKYL